jgi:GNAT superfamily N-acetyltransferase
MRAREFLNELALGAGLPAQPIASGSPDEALWTIRTQANEYLVKFDFEPEPQEDEYDDYDDYERAYNNSGMNTAFYARDKNGQWTMDITNVGEKELTQIIATVARLLAEFLKQHKHLRYIGIGGRDQRRNQIYQRLIQQNLQRYFPGQEFAIDQGGIRRVIKEFAPMPDRDHNDDVPDPIFVLANRWWNATDRQPQIEHVLNSLGWSIQQVESEDDAVQLQHRSGTTLFISADEFDPDLFEYQEPKLRRANRDGIDLSFEKVKDDEYVDDDDDENIVAQVTATSNGKELGHVLFSIDGNTLLPQDLEVDERYRGQGVAKIMYDYVKSLGYQIRRSGQQTDAGAGFWSKHRPSQNVWESELDEIAHIPQSELGGWGKKGTLTPPTDPVKKKELPGGSGYTYAVNKPLNPDYLEIMIFDGDTLAAELDLFQTKDPLNTWRVDTVVVDPDYRGQGMGKALYGIALSILKLTIEAGETQTKFGQAMWLMLDSIPGVEVLGYAMAPTEDYRSRPGDRVVDQNDTWTRYTFPVEPGRRSMRSTRPGTGIYSSQYVSMIARWTGS